MGSAGRRGQSYLCAYEHRAGDRSRSILNHAGKGDSNLSVFLASKKAAIASGTLAEDAVDLEVFKPSFRPPADDLEVFKPSFRPPADAVPSALGGEHCLGLWAELCGIAGVWNYAVCLNRDLNPLRLPSDGWDSESHPHNVAKEAEAGGRGRASQERGPAQIRYKYATRTLKPRPPLTTRDSHGSRTACLLSRRRGLLRRAHVVQTQRLLFTPVCAHRSVHHRSPLPRCPRLQNARA